MRPTRSLARAWWFALLLGVPGILLGRSDLLVFAVPFIVYVAWAWAARPAAVDDAGTTPAAAALSEGDAALIRIRAGAAGSFTSVQLDGRHSMDFEPRHGTVLGVDGEVAIAATPDRWGRFLVPPAPVAVTDPTTAWRDVVETDPVALTVRPGVQQLQGGTGVTRPTGISGIHRSRHRGEGTDLADIRAFVPGDRLKRINWRVSSRTGGLHVNSMFVERDTDVLVVVDTLTEYSSGLRDADTSLDVIARALTSITAHYVGFGDRVAVHDLGGRIRSLRAGSGPRQAQAVLESLSRTTRSGKAEGLIRRVPHVGSGTMVFFLSPLLDAPVRDELVRLRQLGGEVVGVDTMPDGLGRTANIKDFRADTLLGEAWVLRRLERDDALDRMQQLGIPVVPWQGPTSLATVLRAMEAARTAPRIR